MSDTPDRLTIEAARDGGYTVVGRDKAVLYAGDLAAVTSYVMRTIRKVEAPLPRVQPASEFNSRSPGWRPSLFA
jgi:hypothetical protein